MASWTNGSCRKNFINSVASVSPVLPEAISGSRSTTYPPQPEKRFGKGIAVSLPSLPASKTCQSFQTISEITGEHNGRLRIGTAELRSQQGRRLQVDRREPP